MGLIILPWVNVETFVAVAARTVNEHGNITEAGSGVDLDCLPVGKGNGQELASD